MSAGSVQQEVGPFCWSLFNETRSANRRSSAEIHSFNLHSFITVPPKQALINIININKRTQYLCNQPGKGTFMWKDGASLLGLGSGQRLL